jgi:glycosyltransferase involved in cell wall biosynthesis
VRILHILCDLSGGGAERLVLELCRASRHQTTVATVQPGGALAPAFAAASIEVRCAGRRRRRLGLRALARIARWSADFDLVHTHLWAGDLWGRTGAQLAGRPVVTTEHNARADSPLRGALWRGMAPLSDAIVCVSEAARLALVADGLDPSRLTVIANGIDLSRFTPLPPTTPTRRRVLAMGRLTEQKGFDVLLRAVIDSPGLELTIVGEGELRGPLQALVEQTGGRARLAGWVPDVRPLLAAADVVAVPSRWEGFGLVAAEAMACGRPVVASRVDGLVEVVGEAGILVPPEDPAALGAALRQVCEEPGLWEALRGRGLARAARLDVRLTARAYDNLYEGLVSPG